MAVISIGSGTKPNKKSAVVKAKPTELLNTSSEAAVSVTHFSRFWDLMDTVQVHGYVSAAMSVIGRSTVGAWWSLAKSEEFGGSATDRQHKRLMQFYTRPQKMWDNIKDFQSLPYKLMIGAMYLRFFGFAAYKVLRNQDDYPIGLDFLHGYVVPNVDERGFFKKGAAFYQYLTRNTKDRVEHKEARDIVYIINPDWEGHPTGGSDIAALGSFNLPLDIYLQTAAREYMKNRDKPEAFYVLPSDTSDEAFDEFVATLAEWYAGPKNIGRSPVAVQGDLEIKELSRLPSDLPYQEARKDTRQELLAVAGVAGSKLGITDNLSSANLRESRREFHETTMIPLFRFIEAAFTEQIHQRIFGIMGWEFKFMQPDFLTAVERATVHMRYYGVNSITPNQIRSAIGLPARTDPGGDMYFDQLAEASGKDPKAPGNNQGSPPEGREDRPDAPGNVGEPTLDDQDPPRGDQHDDQTRESVLRELRTWRDYQLKRLRRGKAFRKFVPSVIPDYLAEAIQSELDMAIDYDSARAIFGDVESILQSNLEVSDE